MCVYAYKIVIFTARLFRLENRLELHCDFVRNLRDSHFRSLCCARLLQRNIERSCVPVNRPCVLACRQRVSGENISGKCALRIYYILLLGGVLTPRDIGDGMHRPARSTTEENIPKRNRINERQIFTVHSEHQYSTQRTLILQALLLEENDLRALLYNAPRFSQLRLYHERKSECNKINLTQYLNIFCARMYTEGKKYDRDQFIT